MDRANVMFLDNRSGSSYVMSDEGSLEVQLSGERHDDVILES
jgi:hypothetical protein